MSNTDDFQVVLKRHIVMRQSQLKLLGLLYKDLENGVFDNEYRFNFLDSIIDYVSYPDENKHFRTDDFRIEFNKFILRHDLIGFAFKDFEDFYWSTLTTADGKLFE